MIMLAAGKSRGGYPVSQVVNRKSCGCALSAHALEFIGNRDLPVPCIERFWRARLQPSRIFRPATRRVGSPGEPAMSERSDLW